MFISLLTGISLGWLLWKLQDTSIQNKMQKEAREDALLSKNQHLDNWIKSSEQELKKRELEYDKELQVNKALHERYFNDFKKFKEETIEQHLVKKEQEREAWKKTLEKRKARKREYAKKHLDKGADND
jgi:hypothetical protein